MPNPEGRRLSFQSPKMRSRCKRKATCGGLFLQDPSLQTKGCTGTKGECEWSDLLLSSSARKTAFFTFLKVWFEFVLQMRKDGTESVTDLPKATQRVNGQAEERTHCSSVQVQMCPPGLNHEPLTSPTVSPPQTSCHHTYWTKH